MIRAALATAVVAVLALPGAALAADISVNTTADTLAAGSCSLRKAISAANLDSTGPNGGCTQGSGTDVIFVPASGNDYALQIPKSGNANDNLTGDLDINSNLTIRGAGVSATVIEGSDLDRVFDVFGANTVELRDLTVAGGKTASGANQLAGPDHAPGSGLQSVGGDGPDGENGGGILNTADLSLTRVSVQDNIAGDGGDGGDGGAAGSGAAATVGGNSIGGNGGTGGNGGGISNAGTLTILDSTISQNLAGIGGAAGDGGDGGDGGANGAGTGANGGNSTGGLAGSGGSGGGIFSTGGVINITRTVISENSAGRRGTGGDGGDAGDGGSGVPTGGNGGNSLGGGGFYGGFGGGISVATTPLSLIDSTVRDNNAGDGTAGGDGDTGGTGGTGTGGDGAGGDAQGGPGGNAGVNAAIESFFGPITISRSTISGNQGGDGGAGGAGGTGGFNIVIPGLAGDSFGGSGGTAGSTGGIGANSNGSITNTTIASNRAGAGGAGGLGGTGPKTSTGGDGALGGSRAALDAGIGATFTLNHNTIAANETGTGGAGGGQGTGVVPDAGTAAGPGLVGGFFSSGAIPVRNTLIASNDGNNCGGSGFTDNGNNLSFPGPPDDSSCPATLHGAPLLGPLANNGGFTLTRELGAGSAALDQVPLTGAQCQGVDQRGVLRPSGTACDVGALELSRPTAVTGASSAITTAGAKIAGTVNPGGVPTTYRFQFGTTTAYGSQTAITPAGSGASNAAASATLTGLTPTTTYHYRVIATSPDGTATGVDHTFRTAENIVAFPPPLPFAGLSILTKSARLSKSGRASIKVRCPAAAVTTCRGTLTFTARIKVKRKRKTVKLGKANVSLKPGQTKTIKIKIKKSVRTIIKRRKRLKATLTAAARDARGGKAKTTKRKVTLKAAKRKRKR